MTQLKDRLIEARESVGMDKATLQRAVLPYKLTHSAISQIESGSTKSMKASTALAISRATGYRVEYLVLGKLPKRNSDAPVAAPVVCPSITPRDSDLLMHCDAAMKSELAANLAENTKTQMESRRWPQRELAKRSGVSQSGVGYVLRYQDASDRHAGLDTVEQLASAFGMSSLAILDRPTASARNPCVADKRNAHNDDIREGFSKRLAEALAESALAPDDPHRWRSWMAKRYGVSQEAVRKWLSALAIPEMTKVAVIAMDFGRSVEYLLTGKAEGGAPAGVALLPEEAELLANYRAAPQYGKSLARNVLATTALPARKMRANAERTAPFKKRGKERKGGGW